jgi:hypothetical protein
MTNFKLNKIAKIFIFGSSIALITATTISILFNNSKEYRAVHENVVERDKEFNPDKGIDSELIDDKDYMRQVVRKCDALLIDKKEGRISPEYFYHACS